MERRVIGKKINKETYSSQLATTVAGYISKFATIKNDEKDVMEQGIQINDIISFVANNTDLGFKETTFVDITNMDNLDALPTEYMGFLDAVNELNKTRKILRGYDIVPTSIVNTNISYYRLLNNIMPNVIRKIVEEFTDKESESVNNQSFTAMDMIEVALSDILKANLMNRSTYKVDQNLSEDQYLQEVLDETYRLITHMSMSPDRLFLILPKGEDATKIAIKQVLSRTENLTDPNGQPLSVKADNIDALEASTLINLAPERLISPALESDFRDIQSILENFRNMNDVSSVKLKDGEVGMPEYNSISLAQVLLHALSMASSELYDEDTVVDFPHDEEARIGVSEMCRYFIDAINVELDRYLTSDDTANITDYTAFLILSTYQYNFNLNLTRVVVIQHLDTDMTQAIQGINLVIQQVVSDRLKAEAEAIEKGENA